MFLALRGALSVTTSLTDFGHASASFEELSRGTDSRVEGRARDVRRTAPRGQKVARGTSVGV